jgi:hypothetical protein
MPFPPLIDELSPETIGEDKITLALDPATPNPRAFAPVLVSVDYGACAPDGVVLPMELLIQSPSAGNVIRKVFRRTAPLSLAFTPREGGLHGVLLRELGHNRWKGLLRIQVAGDPLTPQ